MSEKPSDERVWSMCQYLNRHDHDCRQCAETVRLSPYGLVHPGCRLFAEEAIRVALTGGPFEPKAQP